MTVYSEAYEVQKIAEKLIPEHHPHLANAKIVYLFRDKAFIRNGIEVWGKASKVTGKYIALTGYDFVIEIAKDVWDRYTGEIHYPLVDHELSHCGVSAEGNFILHDHDFDGFIEVYQRHGCWTNSLKEMRRVTEQLEFSLGGESSAKVAG